MRWSDPAALAGPVQPLPVQFLLNKFLEIECVAPHCCFHDASSFGRTNHGLEKIQPNVFALPGERQNSLFLFGLPCGQFKKGSPCRGLPSAGPGMLRPRTQTLPGASCRTDRLHRDCAAGPAGAHPFGKSGQKHTLALLDFPGSLEFLRYTTHISQVRR